MINNRELCRMGASYPSISNKKFEAILYVALISVDKKTIKRAHIIVLLRWSRYKRVDNNDPLTKEA